MGKTKEDAMKGSGGFAKNYHKMEQGWEAEELATLALEKVQLGQHKEAEMLLIQALAINPELTGARMTLGFIKKKRKDYIGALAEYQSCEWDNNIQAVAAYNIGNIYRDMGKLTLAICSYEKALEKQPEFIEALTNLGLSMLEDGRTKKAIEILEKAEELNPGHIAALNNLGKAYIHSNNIEKAISILLRAYSLGGNATTEILQNIGTAYLVNNQAKEALSYFEQALAENKGDVISLCGAARSLASKGEHRHALKYCDMALKVKPDDGNIAYQKATILEAQGAKDESRELYERAASGPTYVHAAERRLACLVNARIDKKPLARALSRIGSCRDITTAMQLDYAIAKYKEDLEEKSAYSHYELANKLELRTRKYKRLDKDLVIQRNEAFSNTSSGSKGIEALIFLIGLPHSGGDVIERILKESGVTTTMGEKEYSVRLDQFMLDSNIYGIPDVQQTALKELHQNSDSTKDANDRRIFGFEYCKAATKIFPASLIIECKRNAANSFLTMMRTNSRVECWGCGKNNIAQYLEYYEQVMAYQRKSVSDKIIQIDMEALMLDPVGYWQELMSTTSNLRGLATKALDSKLALLINSECRKLHAWPYHGSLNKVASIKKQIEELLAT